MNCLLDTNDSACDSQRSSNNIVHLQGDVCTQWQSVSTTQVLRQCARSTLNPNGARSSSVVYIAGFFAFCSVVYRVRMHHEVVLKGKQCMILTPPFFGICVVLETRNV